MKGSWFVHSWSSTVDGGDAVRLDLIRSDDVQLRIRCHYAIYRGAEPGTRIRW
jgi:hypothetical protein